MGLIKENKFSQIAILEYNLSLSFGTIKPLQFVKLKKFEEEYIGLPLVTNELLINKFSIDKSNTIFIDDNLRNIAAAESFGIKSIHFTSANDLENNLISSGLLTH